MESVARERNFEGGANCRYQCFRREYFGDTNVPEYSSKVLSEGGPTNLINSYINDKNKPFINRAISDYTLPALS